MTPRYFEDQAQGVQAVQRDRRREEIAAIAKMKFPVRAQFGPENVSILGPADRFSPYKEQAKGPEDPFQLLVQRPDGTKFITFASGLLVKGQPLVTRLLPLKPRPNPFASVGVRPRISA